MVALAAHDLHGAGPPVQSSARRARDAARPVATRGPPTGVSGVRRVGPASPLDPPAPPGRPDHDVCHHDGPERSEEHTSELQSQSNLVCRLLLEKKNKMATRVFTSTQV